jgi:putative RNA 2'-phosphotransferase
MDPRERTRLSKFLSKHLRHEPESLGLTLAAGGWVDVEELLQACAAHGVPLSRAQLVEIVTTSDKQRFAFDETGTRIRANQGHTTEVDLQLESRVPPAVLYHGTPAQNVEPIRREGLKRMARHHVHLSADVETASRVGARRGKPAVLRIDAVAMHAAGHLFYCSDNGVWLVDAVPPAYIALDH